MLLFAKLMFDKYDLLTHVTKDFDAGLGAASISSAATNRSSRRRNAKRDIDSMSEPSMATAVMSLGAALTKQQNVDKRAASDDREAALRKEVITLWREWNAEEDPSLKEFLFEEKKKVLAKLNDLTGSSTE